MKNTQTRNGQKSARSLHFLLSHLLQLIVQDVGANVGHHLSARREHGTLRGVQLIEVGEANIVALTDGIQIFHVAVRYQFLELVAGEDIQA